MTANDYRLEIRVNGHNNSGVINDIAISRNEELCVIETIITATII